MPSILIVCTANQCRSPMAMVLLRKQLKKLELKGEWKVDSAGTWATDDVPATENAIQVMARRGLDLEEHRARRVNETMLSEYDLILTMEDGHKEALQIEFPKYADKVYLLSEMVGEGWEIKDPIGGPIETYFETADLLESVLDEGMERMLQIARSNAAAKAEL